ncbi:hypothetical protein [Streptomyces sp. NPDC056463]|uniref:hypothetical protein n=1 Tax=unclassified Streptomyces TaxID=2593676 RepID=UPI0036C3C6B1
MYAHTTWPPPGGTSGAPASTPGDTSGAATSAPGGTSGAPASTPGDTSGGAPSAPGGAGGFSVLAARRDGTATGRWGR